MFERIASGIARLSTRRPWLAIVAVIAFVAIVGAQGMPTMSNESSEFAPDAPAIVAAERIDELFGSEASITPLQVVFVADSGDVITRSGYEATTRVAEAIRTTEVGGESLGEWLAPQPGVGEIVSFMTPIDLAVAAGAPAPTNDEQVRSMLREGVERLPAEQAALLAGLVEDRAALDGEAAGAGLLVAFLQAPSDADDEAQLTALQGELASTLETTSFDGISALPFSPQLIAYAGDEAGIEIPILLFAAIGIIALVLLLVYLPRRAMPLGQRARRTFADTLLTVLVVLFAITTVNGMGVILGPDGLGLVGNVSGPSSIVPILIVGLGVDYVIHVNAAYRDGLGDGEAVEGAMRRSVKVVGGALVLSALTTAFGFMTNVFSGTSALATFGILSTIGIGAAFLYATAFFPAARVVLDRRAAGRERLPAEAFRSAEAGWADRLVGATAVLPTRAPWVAVGMAVIVLVTSGLIATNLRSGFSFTDFVPVGSPVRAAATELTSRFEGGLGETTQVLVEGDITEPSTWNATLAATAAAGSIDGVVTTGGSPRVQSPQQLVGNRIDPASPTYDPAIAAAADRAGLERDLTAGPGTDLEGLLATVRSAAPDELAAVHDPEASLFIFTTQAGSANALSLAAALEAAFGTGSVATSREIIDAKVVESTSGTQVQSLILALVGAGLLLMVNFWVTDRRPVLGILTIAPVGGVVVLLYAFMVLAGIEFGPVTATLAAVVIGVGVDYTIHVTHRFQDFRREGLDPDLAITKTLRTTGSALSASAVTTALGFAILTQSSLIPFQQLGALILAAVAGSALVSILVLPSMLTLYMRWSGRRARARERGSGGMRFEEATEPQA